MTEIPVAELQVSDIGSRAIAVDKTGNAYDGTLLDINATDWKYGKRPEEMVRVRLSLAGSDTSKLELRDLPLDFRIQVDRGDAGEVQR